MSISHVNNKSDLGTVISAPRHWLDTPKNKNASCQNGDYTCEICESHVVTYGHREGSALYGFVGRGMKWKVCETLVFDVLLLKEGLTEKNPSNNNILSSHSLLVYANVSRLWARKHVECPSSISDDSWPAAPLLNVLWAVCLSGW